ncbi:MAG: DNA mismatch repair protein MutS [bacterium]
MTPMLKQYFEIKEKHKDNILFFRLGDFYEMFGDDAKKASPILDIVLTARHKGGENEIPMCGVPHHAIDQYVAKLTKAGLKVAICEQTSDPKLPGIVKREVARIITPGTTLNSSLLDKGENNYLASIFMESGISGLAFVDLTTGEFKVSEIRGEKDLISELKKINPAEVIFDDRTGIDAAAVNLQGSFQRDNKNERSNWYWVFKNVSKFITHEYFEPEKVLCAQFKTKNLEGFGIAGMRYGIKAAANLVMYLKETQRTQLAHINKISIYNPYDCMILDDQTIRNLDLIYNYQMKGREGTLLTVLDKTGTAMGVRLLRNWILRPLIDLDKIKSRINAVEYFFNRDELRNNLREELSKVLDIERLLARVGCGRANGRDLIGLKESLRIILRIKEILKLERKEGREGIEGIEGEEEGSVNEIIDLIEKIIIDEPPVSVIDGGIIKEGNNAELDDLRKISSGGKDWIANLQTKERERTGINSLKIKFNNVFGYYIEISNANIKSAPDDYTRKQTLVNGERFITPELKEYEEKVLTAEEKIKDIEYRLFNEVASKVAGYAKELQEAAISIAKLDVLLNFAQISRENNYSMPYFNDKNIINIKDGRHPVIEKMDGVDFVANDSYFDRETQQFILLTGPNMAGKSVYLRQNAIIVLMAQIGCYVPAKSADICITDRVFTRVGASDNIAYGQSTFMVEMQEAANILNNATEKSLIIFDELGRGTSTYDGVSIAWAVAEHIYNNIKAKTLFATHYHELSELEDSFPKIKNYRVAVLEDEGGVIFLHKVIKGGVDRSYGIEVAKLAGLPKELIIRAKEILSELENGKNDNKSRFVQQPLIKQESEIEEEIRSLDLNNMTPMEAMNLLKKLKDQSL